MSVMCVKMCDIMHKKEIPIIAVAGFVISFLLMQSMIVKPANAHLIETTVYEQTVENQGRAISGNINNVRLNGEYFPAGSAYIGEVFNHISIKVFQSGTNPCGYFALLGIWDGTVAPTKANAKRSIASLEVCNVATSSTSISYTLDSNYTIATDDIIGLYYGDDPTGSSSDLISLRFSTAGGVDGVATYARSYDNSLTAYDDHTGEDITMTLTLHTGSSSEEEVCIDTNGDIITDLCFTDTNNDGVADAGQAGALGVFSSNANITQLGTQWFSAFHIGDADNNPDVKTNGVGVFFTIIIIVFSYALLVGIHIMAQKQLGNQQVVVMNALTINPMLLLVMIFLDVGFAWYLGFIEDTIFYTALVIPVGLAGFGIYKQVRGG